MIDVGSRARPFTNLADALENPLLRPGSTIWLNAGTHVITRDITIKARNITIQPSPGEKASICFFSRSGWKRLTVVGDGVQFKNLEIWSNPPHRVMEQRFDRENNHLGVLDIRGNAPETGMFISCSIHDLYTAYWYIDSIGGVLYRDCNFYNFGMDSKDGMRDGEYLYSQNYPDAPEKSLQNCIFAPGYSVTLQLYTETGYVQNYKLERLITLGGYLFHSAPPRLNNVAYDHILRLGTLYNTWGGIIMDDVHLSENGATVIVNQCGADAYPRIAHIGIFNPARDSVISVDVSGLPMTVNHQYVLRNALSPITDLDEFIYDGSGQIHVDCATRDVALPIGGASALWQWDSQYSAWILEAA